MKKAAFLCVYLSLFALFACNTHSETPSDTTEEPVDTGQVIDIHNARNSLDYEGLYRPHAMIPANGISEIELKSDRRYHYMIGAGAKVTGTFRWDNTGSRIILDHAAKVPLVFFVGENHLKLLSAGQQEGLVFQKEP